jgi:tetratricopeptide (TPR) repeat protein
MIVAGDQSWEEESLIETDSGLDEHLLERITNLEETVRRVEIYLETVSDQLGRLERSEVMLRNGLMSLVQEMENRGQLDGQNFSSRWEQLVEGNLQLISAREIFTRYRARIVPIATRKVVSQLRRALLETSNILDNGLLFEAAAHLKKALKLDPANYELVFTVASLKKIAQLWDEAEQLARTVVKLSPRHYEGWILLASILCEDVEQHSEAIEALHIATELRPDEATPKIQLTELLLTNDRLDAALESAKEAVNLQRDGDTLSILAEVLLAMDEPLKAISALKEASGFLPGDLEIRELLAEGYILAGQIPKARSILQELLRQHPCDRNLLMLLDTEDVASLKSARGGNARAILFLDEAEDHINENNLQEAEVALSQAKSEDSSDRLEWLELLLAFRKNQNKINQVITFASSKRHPRLCFQALRVVLEYYMNQNDETKLDAIISAFAAIHPNSSGVWEAKIIRQADRLMRKTINEEDLYIVRQLHANTAPGQEAKIRSLLGEYLLALKHYDELITLIDPIISIEPTMINHLQLGGALVGVGKYEKGLSILTDGLEANPGDINADQIEPLRKRIKDIIDNIKNNASDN